MRTLRSSRTSWRSGLRTFAMAMLLAGCNDATEPVRPQLPEGRYQLVSIDGFELPRTIDVLGHPTPITGGTLAIGEEDVVSLTIDLGPSANSPLERTGITASYRAIRADSAVSPTTGTPELFLRITGNTAILVTAPGFFTSITLPEPHRMQFVEAPE